MAFHTLLISSLITLFLLHLHPTPSLSDLQPDPDTESFIYLICNQTIDSRLCASIFLSNLQDPYSDPKALTNVAIDQALLGIDEHLDHFQQVKRSIKLGIITTCEESFLEAKKRIHDLKVMVSGGKLMSMEKLGQMFWEIGGKIEDEIGKCEMTTMVGFDLKEIIEARKKKMSILMEMVKIAGDELVKVMDMGGNERQHFCEFLPFLFHG